MTATRRRMYAQASRDALTDCARECFSTIGYEATTVAEITTRAQLSKGAFYRHFTDKRAAFIELFIARLQAAADLVSAGTQRLQGRTRGDGLAIAATAAAEFASMSITDPVHRALLRQAPEVLGADVYEAIDNEHVLPELLGLLTALDQRTELAEGLPLETIAQLLLRVLCAGNTLIAGADNQQQVLAEVLTALKAFFVGLTASDLRP